MIRPQTIKELGSFKEMFSLKGKVAFVTGAAGGIGRSTAAGFAELGAKVALMDIPSKEELLKQNCADIRERYGAECMYVTGDVSDPASVDAFLKEVVDAYGTIDVVHNNAGVGLGPDCADMEYETWMREVAINQTGSFLVARGCAKIMKDHGHGGSIVTTASMSGVVINTGVAYAATKAAAKHMSAALGIEYAKTGIRFNSVCYGFIVSGMHEAMGMGDRGEEFLQEGYRRMGERTPMGRTGRLEEAVGIVLYLATDLSSFHTATANIVDGGFCIGRRG